MTDRRKFLKTLGSVSVQMVPGHGYSGPVRVAPTNISLHYVKPAKSKGVYDSFASRFIIYIFILVISVYFAVKADIEWKVPTQTVTIVFIVVVGLLTFIGPRVANLVWYRNKRESRESVANVDFSEYLSQFMQIETLQTQMQNTFKEIEGEIQKSQTILVETMSSQLLRNLMNEGEHQRRRRRVPHPNPIEHVGSSSHDNLIAQQEVLKKLLGGKSTRVPQ